MTTYQNSRGEKWPLVPYESDSYNFTLIRGCLSFNKLETARITHIDLLPANYTLICTSDEITEEQAIQIVDSKDGQYFATYKDYMHKVPHDMFCYNNAKQSFHSLLHSLNLSRVVVLKIEE